MKTVFVVLFAGIIGAAVQPFPAAHATGFREKVVYSFCGQASCTDGEYPATDLIDFHGTLYGTTLYGGSYGDGAVFAVDPVTGAETVLHSFQGGADGAFATGALVAVKGILYGTTEYGGTAGALGGGTVFAIDPATGAETVLHSFACTKKRCSNAFPAGALIAVGGKLDGTLEGSGEEGVGGAVFELDPMTGKLGVLYSFCSQQGCRDGQTPEAGVIDGNGTLYGTTTQGGNGHGVVFAVDRATKTEKAIYFFCSQAQCTDGTYPEGVIDVNGLLYGTTYYGGGDGVNGGGTVFSLDPNSSTYTVLRSFHCGYKGICKRGAHPESLIDVGGMLYGVTRGGGACDRGTAFSFDPSSGAEEVIHSFGRAADGVSPYAGLIDVKGKLYGTTLDGGTSNDGTVFELRPLR